MNGSIYEITELMKNEDFVLELEEDFIENLTRTDYKLDEKRADENVSGCQSVDASQWQPHIVRNSNFGLR